jgi:hypothetical protein
MFTVCKGSDLGHITEKWLVESHETGYYKEFAQSLVKVVSLNFFCGCQMSFF